MQPTETGTDPATDDLDLPDILAALARRWRLIVAGVLACLAVATAFLLIKSPVYEARATLRIGQVAGVGPFESAEQLAARLMHRHGEYVADGIRRPRPFLRRAATTKLMPGTIELVAEAHAPQDAVRLLADVRAEVGKAHDELYARNVEPLAGRLKDVDTQRQSLSRQFDDTSVLMDRLRSADPAQAAFLALERSRISSSLTALDAERSVIAARLTAPQTQPTGLLGEIAEPADPVAPRKGLVLAVGALLGLILGAALAFAAERAAPASGRRVR
jgi:LPS O-antigen subunit length determinant protein (WzzB/FepE family)